jgi:hypothetical protein
LVFKWLITIVGLRLVIKGAGLLFAG